MEIIDATFLKNADLFGDQDPFIRFKYGRGALETTVKDGAGKYAEWYEKFELTNVKRWIEEGQMIQMDAMEKDPGSEDFLGAIKPLELKELCAWEGLNRHDLQFFDEKNALAGRLKFSTEFKWQEYIPQPPSEKLAKDTMMKIKIDEATFLRDGELFGKQDPYVQFMFGDRKLKTDVEDGAGLHAKFNAVFLVPDVITLLDQSLVFKTFDSDMVGSDKFLGETDPVDIEDIV